MGHASDMSFPTPPNDAPPPEQGGGFGPPQAFGPPPPSGDGGFGPAQPPAPGGHGGYNTPQGGYGAVPPGGYGPAAPGGYAQGGYGQGGYGGPPPPPSGGGKGPKIAAVVVGAVVVAAIVIGGIVWLGSSLFNDAAAKTGSSAPDSASSGAPAPGDPALRDTPSGEPGATIPGGPAATPGTHSMPYVKLKPGACFDSPSLDSTVSVITTTSCNAAHDGEVITNEKLTGTVTSETDLRARALDLCQPDARERLKSIPDDGRDYYNYALYPDLLTYQSKGEDTVSCALTLSNSQQGQQLTQPLP
jgi:hypothetical protein